MCVCRRCKKALKSRTQRWKCGQGNGDKGGNVDKGMEKGNNVKHYRSNLKPFLTFIIELT